MTDEIEVPADSRVQSERTRVRWVFMPDVAVHTNDHFSKHFLEFNHW